MKKSSRLMKFSFSEQNQILKFLFSYAKPEWLKFSVSLVFTLVNAGIVAYLPVIIKNYIDGELATGNVTVQTTFWTVVAYFILMTIDSVVMYYKDYLFLLASQKSVASLRQDLYDRLIHFGMRYFDQEPNGTVVSRVTNDTETIVDFWQVFLVVVENVGNVVAIAIAMFSLNASMAWIFIAFMPIVLLLVYIYQKWSTIVYSRMREALSGLNAKLSESISGMGIIQQFGQEKRMAEEFDDVNQEYVKWRKRMFAMNALLLQPAVNFLETVALTVVLHHFGVQVLSNTAWDVGILYAFVSYSKSFFAPIGAMLDSLSIYQDGLVSGSRVRNLMTREDVHAPESNPNAVGKITDGKVEIRHLNFSYDGENDVLYDINITANPGETIAFVGQTGSGKSSIINVLMRFYEYHSGDVKIDDQDIRDISMQDIRKNIGLVLQDSFMFYGNIADNIRLHGNYPMNQIDAAARFAHADQFICSLDDGYDSKVIEGGKAFSTGEKQLISFSRTILREPKILILDEATANIDTETEQRIQSGLENLRRGRTTIMIAHRLSTIKDADRIYVLKHGRIIESGTHDELLAQNGYYRTMYQLQSFSR